MSGNDVRRSYVGFMDSTSGDSVGCPLEYDISIDRSLESSFPIHEEEPYILDMPDSEESQSEKLRALESLSRKMRPGQLDKIKDCLGLEDEEMGKYVNVMGPDKIDMALDYMNFLERHPGVPDEYATSDFNNYEPMNESQRDALDSAMDFLDLADCDPCKIFVLSGRYGSGSNHLALSLAREFEKNDSLDVHYYNKHNIEDLPGELKKKDQQGYHHENDVYILSDAFDIINGDYGIGLRAVIDRAISYGCRLIVSTSERPKDDFITNVYRNNDYEKHSICSQLECKMQYQIIHK